ncbi:LOW QUALITY PROTEIN: hypothetical protein CFOL_v3_21736, partial [Cephalotus follicularis]
KNSSRPKASNSEPEGENAYASFQGLLALARITGSNADEAHGACKKCGRVGHLNYQCRYFLSIKDDIQEKDLEAIQGAVLSGLDKLKGKVGKVNGKNAVEGEEIKEEEDDDSKTSDSDADSEMERIIAKRYGKKDCSKEKSSRKRKENSDKNDSDSDSDERKKKGRSKKRRSKKRGEWSKRRKEKRRKRDESLDEEDERRQHSRKSRKEKRRRSHRHSDDSDFDSEDSGRRHKQKSRRAVSLSDSDASSRDDPWVGRGAKLSEKRSRKCCHVDDE